MPWYLEQIKSCTYRQFTTGFFYGKPSEETQIYDNNTYEKGYTYLGIVVHQMKKVSTAWSRETSSQLASRLKS